MNKKLIVAAMSLAALTACTNDDFDSQKVAGGVDAGSVQFNVLNNNETFTRASMNGNNLVWNANDGDLFTLYFGAAELGATTGYENATYKAEASAEGAFLSTPTMIKTGFAIMVWPVDTTFRVASNGNLSLTIPEVLNKKDDNTPGGGVENAIPYVSDQIAIGPRNEVASYNTAGLNRKYNVYMRPMASQLNLKADYTGMDLLDELTNLAEDPIDPISLTSVTLRTAAEGNTKFTQLLPIKFTEPTNDIVTQWADIDNNRSWVRITDFDLDNEALVSVPALTTKVIEGTESCKFLLLPQAEIGQAHTRAVEAGVEDAAIVVNTIYGKVVIAQEKDPTVYPDWDGRYTESEIADAWYRFVTDPDDVTAPGRLIAEETATEVTDADGKIKVTSKPEFGMKQTINFFSKKVVTTEGSPVLGEPVGTAATRYVKVLLGHLDMSDLHIKTDKQLRDVVRVWKKLNLPAVTVYLDGDDNGEFEISQKTIETINEINGNTLGFKVQPCQLEGEACGTIVITGGDEIQDIAFIKQNEEAEFAADVVLNEGETWKWAGDVKVGEADVRVIINKGTMVNAEAATLRTLEFDGTQNNVPFINDATGVWNISGGRVTVEFMVYRNIGEVNIASGAQYIQERSTFVNWGETLPERFIDGEEIIGVVNNEGVFATLNEGTIKNWGGLIEHKSPDAKTYITENQMGGNFSNAFSATNKMGTINLPYSNKDEDNISISARLAEGFVSVTIDGEVTGTLLNDQLGDKVNYVRILSGVTEIGTLAQVSYLEVNTDREIAWTVGGETTFDGLIVLSDLNVKLNTTVNVNKATYLDADMYVGGTTNITAAKCNGYFGNTTANFATNYIDYGQNN